MEFIKRMKKREFVEMGLKAFIALAVAFIAIILMEGMIYGIELNAYRKNTKGSNMNSAYTVAYCIKEKDDKYFVLFYNPQNEANKGRWTSDNLMRTKENCDELPVKEVVFHAPNAFEFSITSRHYIVMAVFVAAVSGYFVYKFIALGREYSSIEKKFKESGELEINIQ